MIVLAALLIAASLSAFINPQRVTITGYSGDAMEPFLTRDGTILIFNNSNEVPAQTDLHWAESVDDRTFVYRGKLDGANSPQLDGVASVDKAGTMYFVTTRSYAVDLMTIYRGRFSRGVVTYVAPVQGISRQRIGELNFDAEVSADGNTLYFVDGTFTGGPVPATADIAIAARDASGEFHRVSNDVLAAINTPALEYAPCTSADERELFFARMVDGVPAIYRSTRADKSARWSEPQRLAALTGFVEAPTISPDGHALYYHAKRNGRFVIEMVTRRMPKRRAVGRR